jgi:CRISPR-associated protein Cas5h
MLGLKVKLDCPYFTTFRRPASTSIILTTTIPPYTTLRGMISNALGLPRDDLRVQEWFKIGIKPVNHVFEKSRELAKILKLKGTGKAYQRDFPSSPMFREFLVESSYEIFLVGDADNVRVVHSALLSPKRPLYLGGSDEMVDVDVFEPVEIEEVETEEVWSVVEGIREGCVVEKVPYRFIKVGKTFNVEYKTVSVPMRYPVRVKEKAVEILGEQIAVV